RRVASRVQDLAAVHGLNLHSDLTLTIGMGLQDCQVCQVWTSGFRLLTSGPQASVVSCRHGFQGRAVSRKGPEVQRLKPEATSPCRTRIVAGWPYAPRRSNSASFPNASSAISPMYG